MFIFLEVNLAKHFFSIAAEIILGAINHLALTGAGELKDGINGPS